MTEVERSGLGVLVLAAGAGTRMKSSLPKPMHAVAGMPMIDHVLRAALSLRPGALVVVASPDVDRALEERGSPVQRVIQDPPMGTGHAVLTGLSAMPDVKSVLVLYADHPLVAVDDLAAAVEVSERSGARVTVLTCVVDDAASYGRVDRDETGRPTRIVELVADDQAKRQGRVEINSGIMVLDREWAANALASLPPNPAKGEVFLTDLVELAARADTGSPVITVEGQPGTLMGVNDRADLAAVERVMNERILESHMRNGVTIRGPESVFIEESVIIGADSTILPFTVIQRGCTIGERCTIGPGTRLEGASIGNDAQIESSVVRDSRVGDGSHVGPFSHLRGGTEIGPHVHIGNFVETKNAHIAPEVRAGHVSYLGDTTIGERTNIGAGTVTCNFDGIDKHHTHIGSDVFIGSDSMLVAPLTIGDGAATGAGSVVTRDVEAGIKVVGVPARQIRRRQTSGEGQGA